MKSHKETDTRTFSRTNVYRHDRSKTTDPEPSGIFTVPDAPCPDRIRLTAHSAEYSQYTAPPKSSHRLHGKSSCIEACQPRVSAVSAAVFVRSQSTGRPHAASTASRYSAIGVNPAAARSEPRRAASSTGQSRKAPSHSDPLQTSASRSAAAICHASACDRTPMHHPPFRSYLSPQPFRPSADSVQYPPAKHC